ncbi:MAG TPA: zinc ABC transporter substrate-binding protein [Longimicrobiales bacterium]|nr:zinc ABC transporter substrate-binding protein [Longimicrobiales bacterium]
MAVEPGRWFRFALCVCLVLSLAACARRGGAAEDGRIRIVTTIGMITDITQRVGGEHVRVQGLMGPGVDPHLYKARAGDVRKLTEAQIILYGGLHLEAAMGEVLEEMSSRTTSVAVTDSIPRSQLLRPSGYAGTWDPHVWFDVELWMHAVEAVERTLSGHDPAHAADYRRNAGALLAELGALDAWVHEQVATLPEERRVLVTAHDAFSYFGRAYGFRVIGLQGISTATEAGTRDVQRLAEEIARLRIPAIFVESSIPRRTVEAVQAAVGARGHRVAIGGELFSDALGTAGTPEGTYIGMVRHNVKTIVQALGGVVTE